MSASSSGAWPAPGEIVHVDFREARAPHRETPHSAADSSRPLRLAQWNIERGYCLAAVVEHLLALDADVLSLQEVDAGCKRSKGVDTGREIARALRLNYLFLCEFEELESPIRNEQSQGGGVHGNAILSRYDFTSWRALEHSRHPVDWEAPAHKLAAREPRHGRRLTLVADVATPQGPLAVYCCHLEVFCGMLDRMWQFSDVMGDIRRHYPLPPQPPPPQTSASGASEAVGVVAAAAGAAAAVHPVAVLGDLNTMAHSVARLSPHYACDAMRWRTLGLYEAQVWDRQVFAWQSPNGEPNPWLLSAGLPRGVCDALVNARAAPLVDPFDPVAGVTLDNQTYRLWGVSLMAGKLDWVLLRGMRVVSKCMGNDDYAASDHKWLLVEVQLG